MWMTTFWSVVILFDTLQKEIWNLYVSIDSHTDPILAKLVHIKYEWKCVMFVQTHIKDDIKIENSNTPI